jgi:late competence protein required for DNA uptake (superfamily II DNA/RNA helicase)
VYCPKELILTEWPKLLPEDRLTSKLNSIGINCRKAKNKGITLLLYFDTIQTREEARAKLQMMSLQKNTEFMVANCPAVL